MSEAGSSTGPIRTISKGRRHRIASYFRSKGIRWDSSHVIPLETTENCPLGPSPKRSMMKMFSTIALNDVPRQGRSMTPSSSGSNRSLNRVQRSMMTGLQDTVQEWKNAPLVSTLPQLSFASSLSVCLEEGMCQMSEVITGMLETALSDQGSQEGQARSAWRTLKEGRTATSNHPWSEYWFNGEVCFGHPNVPTL